MPATTTTFLMHLQPCQAALMQADLASWLSPCDAAAKAYLDRLREEEGGNAADLDSSDGELFQSINLLPEQNSVTSSIVSLLVTSISQ